MCFRLTWGHASGFLGARLGCLGACSGLHGSTLQFAREDVLGFMGARFGLSGSTLYRLPRSRFWVVWANA